uniref:Parathyroid hormone-related protein n=1 Tax=Apteryx owenii TaxID=8824 RepID=A0A8B9PFI7_APTOW
MCKKKSRSLSASTFSRKLLRDGEAGTDKRAVTEHQLMHDKGRAFQGLKRLMWLHNALGSVHTASSRDVSLSNAMWDSQKSRDPSELENSISRDETSSVMKQLLEPMEKEQGFPLLKKPGILQYMKTPKGNWNHKTFLTSFKSMS